MSTRHLCSWVRTLGECWAAHHGMDSIQGERERREAQEVNHKEEGQRSLTRDCQEGGARRWRS